MWDKMKEELKRNIEEFNKTTKITIEEESKAIVATAFRGGGPLEDIHAGEEMDIPKNVSREPVRVFTFFRVFSLKWYSAPEKSPIFW